jgi:hypothetical protein
MTHDTPKPSAIQRTFDLFDDKPLEPLPLQAAKRYHFPLQHHQQPNDTILYSVQDWIAGLSGASISSAQATWSKMNSEFQIKSWLLPYAVKNGKSYEMDFTTDEGLYQIAQAMRAMKKRPLLQEIKDFLAKAGAFVELLRQDPEGAKEAISDYRRHKAIASGKSEAWITARELGIQARNQCTASIVKANPETNIGEATNTVYRGVLGQDAAGLRQVLKIGQKQNPRDELPIVALSYLQVAEASIATQLEGLADDDIVPLDIVRRVIAIVAQTTGRQASEMAVILGVDIVTGRKQLGNGKK